MATIEIPKDQNIINATIEQEMQTAYIDYSMSVIVSRALPDVRDGLKPVQRRIFHAMNELGLHYNRKEMKCARIVGEVMGKFHPHGDSSIYGALVRMAQPFSLRYPLIKGQGNFGNVDMGPAAMRYTEAKMQKLADEMMHDINKDTVDFVDNYDGTMQEPSVLPTRIPNLLLMGAQGIAVGLATSIPPHNLREIMNGVIALLNDPDIPIEGVKADPDNGVEARIGLMDYIIAPDFPTQGIIYGYSGIKEMYLTGRGRVILRGRTETVLSNKKGVRDTIIITEVPYQVGRKSLIDKITELHKLKRIEGIFDIVDESSRKTRIVLELKKDANPEIIINQLYKYSQLQVSVSGNVVALVNGKPMQLNLRQILKEFVKHRENVIVRRTQFDLKKAQDRIHILEGLQIAQDNIEEVIKVIRGSKNQDEAKQGLIVAFNLSPVQSAAIVAMRLGQLTALEVNKILDEITELKIKIADLEDILARHERRVEIMIFESEEILEKYGDDRLSEIIHNADDLTIEDMIPNDSMVVTVSHEGYIKRISTSEFRAQGRGGIGAKGAKSKDSDFIEFMFRADNHDYLMFFTDKGQVFWKKVWQIPEMSKSAKGRPLVNLIEKLFGEIVRSIVVVKDYEKDGKCLVMSTKKGIIKKTALTAYSRPNRGGIIAINLRDDDELLDVKITSGEDEIVLGTKSGYANRFAEEHIREVGRNSIGVKGINLRENDEVVGMIISKTEEDKLLVITEKGYGKRSLVQNFRKTSRGSKGVIAVNVTDKVGKMLALAKADDEQDLMIITVHGVVIRQSAADIRVMGRNTQGVKLISLREGDNIGDICLVPKEDEEAITTENESNPETPINNENQIEESVEKNEAIDSTDEKTEKTNDDSTQE